MSEGKGKIQKFEKADHVNDYLTYRPEYPKRVILEILKFLSSGIKGFAYDPVTGRCLTKAALAVDAGCGPGNLSTTLLTDYFHKVLGIDISEEQIKAARLNAAGIEGLEFKVAPADTLPALDNSVSLVQAAASAHWFDFPKFYSECDRILTPGGVVAIYSYSFETEIVEHPQAKRLSEILLEIMRRPLELGYCLEPCLLNMGRLTADKTIIPYEEKVRIENIPMVVTDTIQRLFGFINSLSYQRDMFEHEGEELKVWRRKCEEKFMEVYGTEDRNSMVTYQKMIYLLMGRKPVK